ncbi:LysR family hca operon transcriptional activator [Rhizobium sp. BK312]|uniref:LysR family transcriptional regulator n=1 Tax=Rhizobium sp. BK312 TaxID=2587080 RepID=UPI00160AE087|nr:LysR family transcriptional regulator [Rhizobium sp. BK312]MBB3428979.1 LysR family hca operon transcriptional activator [Rhizobium sp. BK312]
MDLRHLRYFVAVAERGSVLAAAQQQLNTSQPSLSRQIRDLEAEIGVKLLERQARGVSLTEAGKVFLDHARLALAQVEAAVEGARRAGMPERPVFAIGFLAGHEAWLPSVMRILREDAPGVEFKLSSQSSPELALALMRGDLDAALLRREKNAANLCFISLFEEPLVAMVPVDHHLAEREAISPEELAEEIYVGSATASPAVDAVVREYAARVGINLKPKFDAGSLSATISVVVSSGGVTLIPAYAKDLLTPNVVARPLAGIPPTIELTLGYNPTNSSRPLQNLLSQKGQILRAR